MNHLARTAKQLTPDDQRQLLRFAEYHEALSGDAKGQREQSERQDPQHPARFGVARIVKTWLSERHAALLAVESHRSGLAKGRQWPLGAKEVGEKRQASCQKRDRASSSRRATSTLAPRYS